MIIEREVKEKVISMSNSFKVVMVCGPRQVGKTTLLKGICGEERTYVSLDNFEIRKLAEDSPDLFFQRYKPPILIDEIQYVPQLLSYIKIMVDESNKKGEFWITGSQQFHLMKDVTESLAGRVGIIYMNGLTYDEIIEQIQYSPFNPENIKLTKKLELMDVFENIFEGSMPGCCLDKNMNKNDFYDSYIRTYIERDVKDLTQIGNELSFYQFLTSVAARTGEQLNYSALANDANITVPTAKSWLSILITSGLIYLLQPYSNNILTRTTKMPKIIFMDTGLCTFLTKWDSKETLEASSVSGHIFETWVISEIVKKYQNNGITIPPIFYYRDKDQNEIDLVINKNNKLYPFEIKKTANPNKEVVKTFNLLNKTKKEIGRGGIICLYQDILPIDENNDIIPVGCI